MPPPHINTVVGTRNFSFAAGASLRDIPPAEAECRRSEIGWGELRKPPSRFRCKAISGSEVKGICGPAFVSVIAALRKMEILNGSVKFGREINNHEIVILEGRNDQMLKKCNIDAFQQAKAAIRAGTKRLVKITNLIEEAYP